ncbi:MAG: DUF1501 domain-containing protein [Verrucomicrobia bacterium]|nr:DUF1501 domain-containing protein [Verrucomicrobiota bacterium]
MDTFDYKPALADCTGQMLEPTGQPRSGSPRRPGPSRRARSSSSNTASPAAGSAWMFPNRAKLVDDPPLIAVASKTNVHGPGTYMMNSGFLSPDFPAWARGSPMPSAVWRTTCPLSVVLPDARKGLPYNQRGCFSSGFLPPSTRARSSSPVRPAPVPDLFPARTVAEILTKEGTRGLSLLGNKFNRRHLADSGTPVSNRASPATNSPRSSSSAPREALDLSGTGIEATRKLYGLDQQTRPKTSWPPLPPARRRLIERGVRFVEVWSGPARRRQLGQSRQHPHGAPAGGLPATDDPVAALLRDLKSAASPRTPVVIWTTEFGRTPFSQGGTGRPQRRHVGVVALGRRHQTRRVHGERRMVLQGRTSARAYCYDLHATVLHLLGIITRSSPSAKTASTAAHRRAWRCDL